MFNINQIPIFINDNKYGNRYNITLTTRRKIRLDKFSNKLKIKELKKKYNLPYKIINKILKE